MSKQRELEGGDVAHVSLQCAGRAPAARYADPAWLAKERQRVLERAWLVAGLSYRAATPGQYFTFDQLDRSVVVLRDGDRVLRAFHNTCRHRGTRLLDGAGTVRAIRCPYHDWKYALDGRLRHVPGDEGFADPIDKAGMGLLPVRVAEALGFIWLSFDPQAPPLLDTLGGIVDEVEPYHLEDMRPIQEVTWTTPCNWKAVLDNATESYHLPVVHGGSVQPLINDRPDFVAHGDHYRLSLAISDYGWRRWVDARTSRGGPYSERQRAAIQKYVLFPNFLMNLVPCHLTIFQVWPIDAGSCRFFYGFYGRKGAAPLEWLRARGTWLASRYILREDWKILERFQRGAAAAPLGEHRFHAGETAIEHFHRVLERWVGE
jgi:phenylpropionate dioxygenase-like ring-hydroxylating dioxygenase large terminal subunit